MTREEFEQMAIGIETGYKDRNGKPIKVGDKIVIYHKCAKYVGSDQVHDYRYICGTGEMGYVYTGKIQRQFYEVRFSFDNGVEFTDNNKWKFLNEKDENGNLKYVLISSKEQAPKLSIDELENPGWTYVYSETFGRLGYIRINREEEE